MGGERVILTVTLNAAVDTTLTLHGALAVGMSQTAAQVLRLPGGKGVNVARVLHTLGLPVRATGLSGGSAARVIGDGLAAEGIAADFLPISGASRTNVALVDGDGEGGVGADPRVTEINEPGPMVTPMEGERFLARLAALLPGAQALTLCGSLPPGLPDDYYARLIDCARGAGVPALLDTSGRALQPGVAAKPLVVKPNREEAAQLIGRPVRDAHDAVTAAEAVRALGASAVALTLGAEGAILVTDGGAWHGRVAVTEGVSPVGSGDAFLAGLLAGLVGVVARGDSRDIVQALRDEDAAPEALARAVACGAANTRRRGAGVLDRDDVARMETLAEVTPLRVGVGNERSAGV
jgi:tagatose 6-phosphate kinase